MSKSLVVSFPEKCIGCELCVMEVQRQLNKIGLNGSPIRVFRNGTKFTVKVDITDSNIDLSKIREVCPTQVFTIQESVLDGLVE